MLDRPRTTPHGLLAMLASIFVTEVVLALGSRVISSKAGISPGLNVLFAFLAILAVLRMPMRAPGLHFDDVSPVFSEPTSALRSPEDALTLWQFMTVSWMGPLISKAKHKKLDNEDVWNLGFEFQHRILHDNFRELKGTVVRRLLAANGLDLIITTTLGVLEAIAGTSI